jgi:hypothetical protein
MPRKRRIEYSGAMYHVMSRGGRREKIYLDDVDRQDFIKTLAEACQKTNWQVHAYCLKAIAGRVHLGSSKAANRSLHSYMRGCVVASAGQGQLGI